MTPATAFRATPGTQTLRAAAAGSTPIEIEYTNGYGDNSVRTVEPLRVYDGRNGYTYLTAYCRLRQEQRTFRLDRINSWKPADEAGRPRAFACSQVNSVLQARSATESSGQRAVGSATWSYSKPAAKTWPENPSETRPSNPSAARSAATGVGGFFKKLLALAAALVFFWAWYDGRGKELLSDAGLSAEAFFGGSQAAGRRAEQTRYEEMYRRILARIDAESTGTNLAQARQAAAVPAPRPSR